MIETIPPDGFKHELLTVLVSYRDMPLIYRGWGL
jgi:hypothetical protein